MEKKTMRKRKQLGQLSRAQLVRIRKNLTMYAISRLGFSLRDARRTAAIAVDSITNKSDD